MPCYCHIWHLNEKVFTKTTHFSGNNGAVNAHTFCNFTLRYQNNDIFHLCGSVLNWGKLYRKICRLYWTQSGWRKVNNYSSIAKWKIISERIVRQLLYLYIFDAKPKSWHAMLLLDWKNIRIDPFWYVSVTRIRWNDIFALKNFSDMGVFKPSQ